MSAPAPDLSGENRFLGDLAPRLFRVAGAAGVLLLALAVPLSWTGDVRPERVLRAYLVAFCFVVSLSLGGLFFTMLQHLTRAGWSVVVRRLAEGFAANLRWIWVLFIPIAVGVFTTDLYHWRDPAGDPILQHKAPYFQEWFWLLRAAFYFAVWAGLGHYFLTRSVDQDERGDPKITVRMERVATVGMILYAFTQTFAIIDWVMALEPHWYSTMFGVYFFAATCCGFFATLVLTCFALQRSGRLTEVITTEHYHDMGKLLFAFGVVFWAYIAYSQYMLIWYANIPEETTFFLVRQLGGWLGLSIFLLIGHFCAPFLALISRYPKRWSRVLMVGALWMLLLHYVDLYWLAMPDVPLALTESVSTYDELVTEFRSGTIPGQEVTWQALYDLDFKLIDLVCLAGLGGLLVAMTARTLGRSSLVPAKDPRLGESLAFENY